MKQRGLVHPRYLSELVGFGPGEFGSFYPSLCTISEVQIVINSFGEEVPTLVAVAGLSDIPCRLAPASTSEIRAAQEQFVLALSMVTLAGYYSQIDSDMAPAIDGKLYAMEGEPEHDGNLKTTRFRVREVE
jgi:hypothetical protein